MNPEEYVDRLIERRERGEKQLPVINDEVAASLAAAEVLTQLREIAVPPEFADYLELYIRARARSFGQQTSNAIPVVCPRSRAGSQRFLARRSWTAVRSEEHTSELQSHLNLVCRLLLEKKKKKD